MPGARLDGHRARAPSRSACSRTTPRRAARSRSRCAAQREDIAQRLAGVAPLNVYVDAGFGASIQRTTLLARLLALAGARLVGPSDGVATVNAKALHKLDPDAYIATSTSGVTLARLRSQPRPAHAALGRRRPRLRRRRRRRARGHDGLRAPALARALAAPHRHQAVTRLGAVTLRRDGDARLDRAARAAPAAVARAPARPRGRPRALRGRDARRDAPLPRPLHRARATRRRSPRCGWNAPSLLADALALDVSGAELLPSLTDAIAFYAYPDARPALERLAAAGLKLAVVANWDVSLHDVLARLGLAELLRGRSSRRPRSAPRSPTRGRSRSRSSVSASRPRAASTSATTP